MNKKYKLTQNIPHNLILGSSKYASGSSSDSFKDQVNNLINKLKTKNKENIHKNTLNLCVVNNSPVNNIKNNFISFTRNMLIIKNPNNSENTKYRKFELKISRLTEKMEESKDKISKKVKNNFVNNNKENKIKINSNILKIIKKYKSQTDISQDNQDKYTYSNKNQKNILSQSKSTKFEYKNIPRNKFDSFNKKYNKDKKEIKLNLVQNSKRILKIYPIKKKSEELFLNQFITTNFDKRFSFYDTYYYKLNKMYNEQISTYMSHRVNWESIEADDFDDSYIEQRPQINFEWKYYPNKLYYKKYKYNSSTPIRKLCAINI